MISLKNSRHLNQVDAERDVITRDFRALERFARFFLSDHRFFSKFAAVMIGYCRYFASGFTSLS